jgi:branched-chain amino acid transport system ATP-binding protein
MFFKLENLYSGYGHVPVICGIDLEVVRGEVAIILGRNGVGKTTLMKTIIGLLPRTSGEIIFNDLPISDLPVYSRACLGLAYVPQGRGIFPDLTVEENLRMGEGINIAAKTRPYTEVFTYFPRLKERLRQKGGTLSGGEQQMLALGRALIGDPRLLLLDEPSEGIQPNIVGEIGAVLAHLNEEKNLTILLVEQNIEYALSISRSCHMMNKGKIVARVAHDELHNVETIKKYLAI